MDIKPTKPEMVTETFDFGPVHFIREPVLQGYVHPCATAEIINLIRMLPEQDLRGLALIVFHQPTRREEMRSPRWAAYYPEFTYGSISGPVIFLEAVDPTRPVKWPTSLTPDDQKELDYLRADGHHVALEKKAVVITMNAVSVRKTQLERSFIHEVGHHVDYKRNPGMFSKKDRKIKESFANRYASENRQNLASTETDRSFD